MYCAGLLRDPYSHTIASVQGWAYVPDPADVQFLNWVDAMGSMHHQPGKVKPQPVKRGWESGVRATPAPPKPENRERRAALKERLGLKY